MSQSLTNIVLILKLSQTINNIFVLSSLLCLYLSVSLSVFLSAYLCAHQCEQMVGLFFNIWLFATMKISPNCHKFAKVGSAFFPIRNKQSKFRPRLVNFCHFAKSGHAAAHLSLFLSFSFCLFLFVFVLLSIYLSSSISLLLLYSIVYFCM